MCVVHDAGRSLMFVQPRPDSKWPDIFIATLLLLNHTGGQSGVRRQKNKKQVEAASIIEKLSNN